MTLILKWIKKLAIPIICAFFIIFLLFANGRISMPWRTGTLDSLYNVEMGADTAAFFLRYSDEGVIFLMQRDAEKTENYLFSLQLRAKFWQTDVRVSDVEAQITLRDSSETRLVINILDKNTIEVNSCVYIVKDSIDLDYIRSCFDNAEDLSYQYDNKTDGK